MGGAARHAIRTVEGALGGVLADLLGDRPRLSVAGRTDAGVHARGQVASFRVETAVTVPRLQRAVNARLGPEVVVLAADEVPAGFDARFSATAREYRYRIDVGAVPDPFTARYVWHHPCAPDVSAIRVAARHLVGEHDFTSFCRHPGAGRPTVRDLQRVSVVRAGDRVELGFRANAFLHQMVRALTGTLRRRGRGEGRSRRDPRHPGRPRPRGGPPDGAGARADPRAGRVRQAWSRLASRRSLTRSQSPQVV